MQKLRNITQNLDNMYRILTLLISSIFVNLTIVYAQNDSVKTKFIVDIPIV